MLRWDVMSTKQGLRIWLWPAIVWDFLRQLETTVLHSANTVKSGYGHRM